jgi:hypothetical protein
MIFDNVQKGDKFTNTSELSLDQEDIIEILGGFNDAEDGISYYIVKCRGTSLDKQGWYYEDEVILVSDSFLYKYFERIDE